MSRIQRVLLTQALLAVIFSGSVVVAAGPAGSGPAPGDFWRRSAPEQQSLDAARLTSLAGRIRAGKEFPDLHSLLIIRNGRLVVEEYFAGTSKDELHTLQSVSKSFTSALVGIAIEQGDLRGVEEKVLAFFPGTDIKNVDARKSSMCLVDLLTMRSGTDYHERGSNSPHDQLNRLSRGWDRFVLDRKMVSQPGTKFQYDSGAVILMSSVLESRIGLHADKFAERTLFPRLGITRSKWYANAEGHPHTGGGLHLRPRDMARFGQLYLQKGRWNGKQVVPESWVEESTRRHVNFSSRGHTVGYGYWWWILEPDPGGAGKSDIYAAMGFRGQYIFVIPEHEMVVVVTGGTRSYTDEQKPIGFLYTDVLPAVQRSPRP